MRSFALRLRENWLNWLTWLVMLAGLLVTVVIASGRLDPQPIGRLQASRPLAGQAVAAGQQRAVWLDETIPAGGYSLKLRAALQNGEQDIGYGLLVGRPEDYLGLAVSPLGYLTIWRENGPAGEAVEQPILPWQTWPHIGRGSERNEIWLNVAGDEVTVRLNGERLWQGTIAGLGKQVGLWTESFGQAAVVDFQELRLYYE
jgi:hypothetical protein